MWRWRISAIASLAAVLSGPFLCAINQPHTLPVFSLLALLVLVRHRNNLIRLAQGRETRF
jgi:glycerol-3-phosphate acyltransferase PlsY